ncbi:MAG: tryptophan-rich sensory protein [Hyphomonadaceae bacterium]
MAHAHAVQHPTLPWNRNNGAGFWLSVLAPTAAVAIGNAIILAAGGLNADPALDAVPYAPPGWFVGLVWLIIYPMWGAARWYARQTGLAGVRRSRWVAALIVWGLLYPIIVAATPTIMDAGVNVVSLALAIIAAWQVRGVSRRAAWLIMPSIFWIAFAAELGFAALANG